MYIGSVSMQRIVFQIAGIFAAFLCVGCSNLPFVTQHTAPTRIFLSDYSTAWTAAMEALGTDVRSNNRDLGTIETAWIENTERLHFLNVFSDEDFFLRARFRLQVQVHQGLKNDQPAVQVRVLKIQQMEKTFLSGWEDVESDGVDEATYLYRIGRLISIQQYNEDEDKQQRNSDDKD
jgi:uncharacterized lipoprotein